MANEEHLKILRQGVEAWNAWHREIPGGRPDFSDADLRGAELGNAELSCADISGADLRGANLRFTNLRYANLSRAVLSRADLGHADLFLADLRRADLGEADLGEADLGRADLRDANLGSANFIVARLGGADLSAADLSSAFLGGADLTRADLTRADLSDAEFDSTSLSFNDLRETKGLELIKHNGPSSLGVDVLQLAQGQLPPVFLKGCGLSDWEIEAAKLYNPNLSQEERTAILYEIDRIQGHQPIQLNPLFISYSSKDAPFVEALERRFDELGVRYWRDVHHLKAGRLETQIDRAIRLNPTVLLVLSEDSVESDWVEWEVRKARELEKQHGRDVLCPVALDDKWKSCRWPKRLRVQIEEYNILDFSEWRNRATLERQFGKLLDGLKLFYRPKE